MIGLYSARPISYQGPTVLSLFLLLYPQYIDILTYFCIYGYRKAIASSRSHTSFEAERKVFYPPLV